MQTPSLLPILVLLTFCAPFASASRQQSAPAPTPDYSSQANAVVTNLNARHFDEVSAQLDATMAAAVTADKLAQGWDQVVAQAGAFQKITSTNVTESSGYHMATVTCAFEKMALNVIVTFDSAGRIAGLRIVPAQDSQAAPPASPWNAPPYADQAKFHEEPVTVSDGQWQLPGALTLPNGKGPFTAVVLISGSGPNDADETIGPNKVFKDIAWGLATHGFAVLRFAKRTHQYGAKSSADPNSFTVRDEYLDDARAAVALLASRPEINAHRIFVAGHSEGGYLAPRIAASDSRIAGIIILEGSTRPIEQLALEQVQYQAKLGGPNAAQIEQMIPQLQAQVKAIEDPNLKAGVMLPFLTAQVPSSYFLDLRTYDPCAVAAGLKIPIYVTQGGRDYQVMASEFDNWQKALAGHSNATLRLYPALNHILIPGTGPSKPEEYFVAGQHVSPEIVSDVAAWLNAR
ncbi:MAG TPA: alpha/beta fold hydrolase [Candidatus Acidoferrales bacterium]|nr:alpha/beta fold hydrolase [Candidatus Acidoferrales bacterium]